MQGRSLSHASQRYTSPALWRVAMAKLCALWVGMLALATSVAAQDVPQLTVGRLATGKVPRSTDASKRRNGRAREPYSAFVQQEPNEGQPATERTEIRFLIDDRNLYIGDHLLRLDAGRDRRQREPPRCQPDRYRLDRDPPRHVQRRPERLRLRDQPVRDRTGRPGDGRRADIGRRVHRLRRRRIPERAGERIQRQLGRRLDRAREHHRARLGSRVRHPAQDAALQPGAGPHMGRQRDAQHPAEERAGLPRRRCRAATRSTACRSGGKLNGLSLPTRRDLRFIPYVAGSVNDDRTLRTNSVDRTGRIGIDVKWGVRADLTLDATVNTDFAQVEADEEQVNLTRFALFFPEKRPFFLENAQMFQVGQPQAVDLFFSRRIGLDPSGQPIDIIGGARLSGKIGGGYNIGPAQSADRRGVRSRGPAQRSRRATTSPSCVCSARWAARTSAASSSTGRASGVSRSADDFNRAYGLDAAWQTTTNGRLFAFLARTDSPASKGGSDYAGRVYYNYAGPVWSSAAGLLTGRRPVQSRGRLPAAPGLSARGKPLRLLVPAEAVAVDSPPRVDAQLQRLPGPGEPAREHVRPLARVRDPAAAGRPHHLHDGHSAGPPAPAVHRVSGRHRTARDHSAGRVRAR